MKLKILGKIKFEGKRIDVPVIFGQGTLTRMHHIYFVNHGIETWEKQKSEPVYISQELEGRMHIWAFKDYAIHIQDMKMPPILSDDEIKFHIKHLIYKKESGFAKMMKEVERFERFDQLQPIARETIPEDVRMYVWRRDQGKCVNCGSNKNLEFDHIIPVSEGGSGTERNLQLLCSDCNKKKSNHI